MSEAQMALELETATDRRYTCCGAPAPASFRDSAYPDFPHADDCPNPNIGQWIDRHGRTIRRLHCGDDVMAGNKPCPTGGRYLVRNPAREVDPYDGQCCLQLRRNQVPPSPASV